MASTSGPNIDPRVFRDIVGHYATGVTVITAQGEDAPVGMACNSFFSVSLDPPLVGLAAAKTSTTWPDIEVTGKFCVNIMASHHQELAYTFSRKDIDRFEGAVHAPRAGGPGLEEANAWIDCEIKEILDAGDHVIILGLVTAMEDRDDETEPLVFYRGKYGNFLEPDAGE